MTNLWRAPVLRRAAMLLAAAALATGVPAAHANTVPTAAAARPGPDILYAPPADAPQLQNTGPWTAPPILVSGAAAYDRGEYLYQDYLADDHGAAGSPDPADPQRAHGTYLYSPKAGTATYPTGPGYAENAADLVEVRTKPLPTETAFRFTLNTLFDPGRVGLTVAIGTSAAPRAWPDAAGVRSPAAYFLTVHGRTARLTDAATGAVVSPSPTVRVDLARRQFDVRVPHTAWNPGRSTVRLAAGAGLWDNAAHHYLVPGATATADRPGGRAADRAALFNLAFRFTEPTPRIASPLGLTAVDAIATVAATPAFWREQAQARALATGDVSGFHADVDFARLAAHVHDDSRVPRTGPVDRILASHVSDGQGIDYGRACGRFPTTCAGIFRGQLQSYALYVPRGPRPAGGWGTALLLHALSTNANLFLGSHYQAEVGDRGRSLVVTPGGRGPDGDYRDRTEADVFETWADVARHYALDPGRATVSGFSMGGGATVRFLERYPDLFAAGASVAAATPGQGGPGPGLASLRNTPLLTWIGTLDEGTGIGRQAEAARAEARHGLRFVFDSFLTADHLTLATNDEYGPLADFLATRRRDPDPPHVTYTVDPRTDSAGLVADHAYWLSRLRIHDPHRAPTGTVDARSAAFGTADPTPLGVTTSLRVLGGAHLVTPYLDSRQDWAPARTVAARNALTVDLRNIGQATIDGARAGLTATAPLRLTVHSDTPATVTLALRVPTGTMLTGDAAARPGPTGVTLHVNPGTSTVILTPGPSSMDS